MLVAPTAAAQTVKVSAKSDGSPIDVYLFLSSDDEVVDKAITLNSESDKIIASQKNSADVSLTAEIPANQEAAVRIQGANSDATKVTLKISNQ